MSEQPEIVVLSLFYHMHDLFSHTHITSLEDAKNDIVTLLDLLLEKTTAYILVNTFIPPFYSALIQGNAAIAGNPVFYSEINYFIKEYSAKYPSRCIVMDWEKYTRIHGEAEAIDYRYWYMNKAPFKKGFLNHYAKDISSCIKTLKGHIKKCLVLDCDNTLWGGIIGEDGIDHIKLDHYDYPGKIYYDFQQSILSLYNRGIIIALCSKNNPDDVWNVLDNHPASLLKKQHISSYRINWQDKATNMKEISEELNLGLDSFVFVDDSPSECEIVKTFLPDISVLQVPKELFLLPQLLLKNNLFETLSINHDDKNRTLSYQQENTRRTYAKQFFNLDDYLESLQLNLNIHCTKENEYTRVAQLTQKTNQFNLRLQRYTEEDIRQLANAAHSKVFSLWASDKFGDYGLTGVLIAKLTDNKIVLDSLLLSCRILSKRIEYAFFTHCLQHLQDMWKTSLWRADFHATGRNHQVNDFLNAVGFQKMEEKNNIHYYQLDTTPATPKVDFIHVTIESNA